MPLSEYYNKEYSDGYCKGFTDGWESASKHFQRQIKDAAEQSKTTVEYIQDTKLLTPNKHY